jgi:3D (Asp-Asp-Asp) domain-containing protein/peptidoglycan hydrolase CwlO-like protein
VPGEIRTLRLWPVVLIAVLALVGLLPAGVAADSATGLRDRASQLTQQNAGLAARSRGVVLELYALDSRLTRERARLVALRIRTAQVKAELVEAKQRLGAARRSLSATHLALARRLQLLYEQGDSDPVAVVLGASSVADALDNLDSLDRVADQDRMVIEQARQASRRASRLARALSSKERSLERFSQEAAQSTLELEQAHAQRSSYLARLAGQQRLNAAAIAAFQQQALAVQAQAQQVSVASPQPASPVPPPAGGSTMTVTATGYSIHGHTATGAPTGWGVVAVDPSLIPLGTRMDIPGYGSGVAADTGSAIQGATIDLWFPTLAQARAWGRRTVTITLG